VSVGIVDVLQIAGVVVSLGTGPLAIYLAWRGNRDNERATEVHSTRLQVSVMPVPIIEGSRLTWRGRELVIMAMRVRNVGAGAVLGLRVCGVELRDGARGFKPLSLPTLDVVMPSEHIDYRLKLEGVQCTSNQEEPLHILIEYFDVLGLHYERTLPLLVTAGSGAGVVAGYLPIRMTQPHSAIAGKAVVVHAQ
jgi:hypothetical protein